MAAVPVLVHFGTEVIDPALILDEDVIETVRSSGNTMDPAVYIAGQHFGLWARTFQENDPECPVWYERTAATDEHYSLALYFRVELEPS